MVELQYCIIGGSYYARTYSSYTEYLGGSEVGIASDSQKFPIIRKIINS